MLSLGYLDMLGMFILLKYAACSNFIRSRGMAKISDISSLHYEVVLSVWSFFIHCQYIALNYILNEITASVLMPHTVMYVLLIGLIYEMKLCFSI